MDNDSTKGGQWGDIFGIVNSLFSGGAFAMIIYGYICQKYQISLAKEQNELQRIATDKQMFENTFFNMNTNFNNYINGLDLKSNNDNVTTGKDVMKKFLLRSKHLLDLALQYDNHDTNFKSNYKVRYEEFLNDFKSVSKTRDKSAVGGGSELLPYFRMIYVILKYVDCSKLSEIDKSLYFRIFRSQFTEAKLKLLALNAISVYGKKDDIYIMKQLIENSHFLENIRDTDFKNKCIENGHFKRTSFGIKKAL